MSYAIKLIRRFRCSNCHVTHELRLSILVKWFRIRGVLQWRTSTAFGTLEMSFKLHNPFKIGCIQPVEGEGSRSNLLPFHILNCTSIWVFPSFVKKHITFIPLKHSFYYLNRVCNFLFSRISNHRILQAEWNAQWVRYGLNIRAPPTLLPLPGSVAVSCDLFHWCATMPTTLLQGLGGEAWKLAFSYKGNKIQVNHNRINRFLQTIADIAIAFLNSQHNSFNI